MNRSCRALIPPIAPVFLAALLAMSLPAARLVSQEDAPVREKTFSAPGVPELKVNFGGQGAPLPEVKGSDDKKDPALTDALKSLLSEPVARDDSGKPGSGGGANGPRGGRAADGGEEMESEEGEGEEETSRSLFKKFVNLFQGEEDDGQPDEATDRNYRKIKELERFAERNFLKGRFAEAKKNLNDLITLKPYDASYHFALGLVFRKEQRYGDALKKYQDVLDLGGPKPLVHLLMSEGVVENGDREKVFEHLKEAAVGGRNIIHDVQLLSLLEEYKTDTDFIKLALSLEKYELQTKKNQDPMTNIFQVRTGIETPPRPGGEPPGGPTILTPEEQQNLLRDARKAYDRVLWYIKLEDDEKAMDNYINLRDLVGKKELVTIPKIANDFRLLESKMGNLETDIQEIRLKFYYSTALTKLKKMKEAFNDTEYGRVRLIFEEVKKLAQEMERTNASYKPVAQRVLTAGQEWITRTQIREEFETNKPTVQGIIISRDTRKAIINDRIYEQGERFEAFVVQKVESNRITFRYKGEEIPMIFRRY